MKQSEINLRIYELVDAFLVEAKDQNGNDRSLDRLNMDRHLFVERMAEVLATERRKAVEEFAIWEYSEKLAGGNSPDLKSARLGLASQYLKESEAENGKTGNTI
ncbi:MAG: hypothetical protein NUV65_03590 [Candidatus Roizmanbacteria bacterium]|nr:hypothetical protein [Candidatus Roizmanbacteria bacterium]